MDTKLFVGNLSFNVAEDQLRELFAQAGEIKEVTMIVDRDTRRPKGFGFVEYMDQTSAEEAIRMFSNYELDGRNLTVNIAKPREDRSRSNGGSRRY